MTLFGKLVMGVVMLFISVSIFYGLRSYVQNDSVIAPVPVVESSSTDLFPVPSSATDQSTSTEATTTLSGTSTESKTGSKKIPFTEFMSKGGSYKCEIMQTVANMTSKGTVYMHDALVRLEFSTSIASQSINTTMIARDNYMYTWTSTTPNKGYKTKIAQQKAGSKPVGTYTWNGSQVGDYTCEAWKADDSFFELPSGVTFSDQ